jgi:hypothetical protein
MAQLNKLLMHYDSQNCLGLEIQALVETTGDQAGLISTAI